MLARLDHAIGWLARLLNVFAGLALVALIIITLWEVVARYVLGEPTIWSFDLAWMLNGAVFLLPLAQVARQDGHIRVQIFPLSIQTRAWIDRIVYLALIVPALVVLTWTAAKRALSAFRTGELDPVSTWAPLMWPFYMAVTIGLLALLLQVLVTTLRGARSGEAR